MSDKAEATENQIRSTKISGIGIRRLRIFKTNQYALFKQKKLETKSRIMEKETIKKFSQI